MDTDVEIIRSLDELLVFDAFYGFETNQHIATGLDFGCITRHPTVEVMKKVYENLKLNEYGTYPEVASPQYNTQALKPYGLILNGQQ